MFRYIWIGLSVTSVVFCLGCKDDKNNTSDAGTSDSKAADVDTTEGKDTGIESNSHDDGKLDGTCNSRVHVGRFEVENMPDVSITAVTGTVAEGVVPSSVMELIEARGDCRLLRRNDLFCDPLCPSGQTCAEKNKCIPYPENISLGTVTVTGLSRALELTPTEIGFRYSDGSIPYPGFKRGDEITLKADGGDYAPFKLRGYGVADFVFLDEVIVLDRNRPLELNWTAKKSQAARIYFTLNVDQHGQSPLTLECDWEDVGQAIISAEVIKTMIDAGVSGIATVHIGRRTVDSITIGPGCIDFIVMSRVSPVLDIVSN